MSKERWKDPDYQAKQSDWYKAWYEKNGRDPARLARKAEQMRAYSKRPEIAERHKARRKVRWEIEMGRMVRQPCEVCGSVEKVHAHHDDYSKPLDVRWLCPTHHQEHHQNAKALGQ